MALDSGYFEGNNSCMDNDDVATLLIKLYGDYYHSTGGYESDTMNDYAKAVGIAIRLLHDYD